MLWPTFLSWTLPVASNTCESQDSGRQEGRWSPRGGLVLREERGEGGLGWLCEERGGLPAGRPIDWRCSVIPGSVRSDGKGRPCTATQVLSWPLGKPGSAWGWEKGTWGRSSAQCDRGPH